MRRAAARAVPALHGLPLLAALAGGLTSGIGAATLGPLAVGCAPTYGDAHLSAFASGQRALRAGRYDEAARAFEDAAAKAERVKDRDEAHFLQARALERGGRWKDARRVYQTMAEQGGPRAARAVFELAYIELDHGDAEEGQKRLYAAARSNPKHGLARHAIQRLAADAANNHGEEARLAWLKERAAELKGTELDETVAYETALSLERLDRKTEARDAFLDTAKRHPYPFGGFTDDALWHAAAIDEELGRYSDAIEHLRRLLSSREASESMGSYERPRYSKAQLKMAELYRDRLKDRAAARREFHKLYTDYPTSILRDDALWAEAVILHEDKNSEEACAVAKRLAKELPDSRYAPCAREICPSAPAHKRACAGYIVRELRGETGSESPEEEPPPP